MLKKKGMLAIAHRTVRLPAISNLGDHWKATRTMPAGHGCTEGKRYAQPTNSVHLLWSASQIKVIERSATWAWNMQIRKS